MAIPDASLIYVVCSLDQALNLIDDTQDVLCVKFLPDQTILKLIYKIEIGGQ